MKRSLIFGLKINTAKTKVMTFNGEGPVMTEEDYIEVVGKFRYLGSMTTQDISQNEMNVRLPIAK